MKYVVAKNRIKDLLESIGIDPAAAVRGFENRIHSDEAEAKALLQTEKYVAEIRRSVIIEALLESHLGLFGIDSYLAHYKINSLKSAEFNVLEEIFFDLKNSGRLKTYSSRR